MSKGKPKPKDEPIAIEESSGNVFADLGLKDPEELLAKAQVEIRIRPTPQGAKADTRVTSA